VKSLSYLRDDERRAALTKLGPPPGLKSNVELISAATIEPVPIKWLWNGWLARGRMNVLAGPPGGGKTTLAGEMAAIVSTGGLWPDGSQAKQGNVVIWTGEDDPEDTLVPRLIALGADLRGVHFVENIRDEIGSRSFDPAKDMIELSNAIQRCGNVRLVIIDPIAMVATKDSHRNAETRRDLQPVADLGRTTGAAVLGIHHLAKGTGGREPQERLIGSIAFAALPRVVMIAMKLPSEDQGASERRVLMRAKSNIGPDDGGFAYTLSQIELEAHPGVFGSRVVWGTPIEGTAREVLAEAEEMEEERSPREEAVEFLKSLLMNGSVPVTEIHAAARKEGISTATLRRAKAQLGVVSCRIGFGKGSIAQWEISPENSYTLKHPIHAHSNQ
jgi:putative DNA primase/helicase